MARPVLVEHICAGVPRTKTILSRCSTPTRVVTTFHRRMTLKIQRIAYLLQMADLTSENGIAKKIRHQAGAWRRAGAAVRIFSLAPTTTRWAGFDGIDLEIMPRGGPVARLWRSRELCARIRAWQPEVIYFRYAYHSPGLPALFRQIPTIAEINSDDTTEYALTLGPAKQLYHRLTRTRLLSNVAGFVPVTNELAARFARFDHPTTVLANGVDLTAFPLLPVPSSTAPLRLVFMGSPGTPWHGLDRIGELAALLPAVLFDIIGYTVDNWRSEMSASLSSPPPNFVFHGNLARVAYEPLLRRATAALGTFGLYRKGMDEACPLKVREYLASGLPVIGACHDTDIPDAADYYLRLPNAAVPLAPHLGNITDFLASWTGRRVPRTAITKFDLPAKEIERLAFMQRISTSFRRPES